AGERNSDARTRPRSRAVVRNVDLTTARADVISVRVGGIDDQRTNISAVQPAAAPLRSRRKRQKDREKNQRLTHWVPKTRYLPQSHPSKRRDKIKAADSRQTFSSCCLPSFYETYRHSRAAGRCARTHRRMRADRAQDAFRAAGATGRHPHLV